MPVIGTTRPSGQPIAAPRVQISPDMFGAGVGSALKNAAASFDDLAGSALDLEAAEDTLASAYKQRQDKTDRFKALTGLSAWEAEQRRVLQDLSANSPADAENFTNAARETVEASRREWLAAIPPDLLEEFDYRSSTVTDAITNEAFSFEYSTRQEFYRGQIGETTNQALSDIYANPALLEDRKAAVIEQIQASDLHQLEKDALILQFDGAAAAASAKKEFEVSALSQGTIGVADGSDIVAAGLPVVARGMLNAIASVEAGGYDVLNGGQKFDDFSDHPGRRGAGGTSTAAGRYQFVSRTWGRVAQAIKAPNFDPEWQDRGAWWLAGQDFKARTGKDLYAELMSGDRERIIAVKKALQGQGEENVTWKGLQNMSDAKWANYILGSHGQRGGGPEGELEYPSGPALFDDPRYANIDFGTKLALAEDGERIAQATLAQQEKDETARYQSWLNEFEFAVGTGEKGRADIEASLANGEFQDFAHVERLRSIYDTRNKGMEDVQYVTSILQNPNGVLAWDDEQAKKGLNGLIKLDNGVQRISQQDPAYMAQAVVPLVQRAGDIPTDVLGTLMAMTRTGDAAKMRYAFESLRQLEKAAPDSFTHRLSEDEERDYRLYMGLRDAMPEAEVTGRINRVKEFRQDYPALMAEVDATVKGAKFEEILDRVVSNISTEFIFDPELPPIPLNRAQFGREFEALYRDAYVMSGDPTLAEEVATDLMKRSWAPTEFGNRYFMMKNPPEKSWYPPIDGGYDWMTTQIETEYPELADASWYQLVADTQTRNEIEAFRLGKRQTLPSYLLFQADDTGNIDTIRGEDNLPVRWRGDPQPFRTQAIEAAVIEDLQVRYNELEELKAMQGGVLEPEQEAERARLADEVRALEPVYDPATTPPPREDVRNRLNRTR